MKGVTDYADCVTGAESGNLIKKNLNSPREPVVGGCNLNSWNKNKLRNPPFVVVGSGSIPHGPNLLKSTERRNTKREEREAAALDDG
jgi:hypothetical protein